MREIFATLEKVSPSELTVMITGETGTGKELIARGIHNASPRRQKPFVVLDCGAIPRDLIESTLVGHEKGSFTGAGGQYRGCFEQAQGGTIFLDEIGELDIGLQPKLLRVLEQREIKRVGGDRTVKVDVRVLAATNRDLRAMVNQGTFREDLYFRLSVIHVELPPLRERREDIAALAHHFLREVASRRGTTMSLSPDAVHAITSHPFPGNVRELRNVVERVASLASGPVITSSDLVFGRDSGPSVIVSRDLANAGAQAAAAALAGPSAPAPQVSRVPPPDSASSALASISRKPSSASSTPSRPVIYARSSPATRGTSRARRRKRGSRATICASCSNATTSRRRGRPSSVASRPRRRGRHDALCGGNGRRGGLRRGELTRRYFLGRDGAECWAGAERAGAGRDGACRTGARVAGWARGA